MSISPIPNLEPEVYCPECHQILARDLVDLLKEGDTVFCESCGYKIIELPLGAHVHISSNQSTQTKSSLPPLLSRKPIPWQEKLKKKWDEWRKKIQEFFQKIFKEIKEAFDVQQKPKQNFSLNPALYGKISDKSTPQSSSPKTIKESLGKPVTIQNSIKFDYEKEESPINQTKPSTQLKSDIEYVIRYNPETGQPIKIPINKIEEFDQANSPKETMSYPDIIPNQSNKSPPLKLIDEKPEFSIQKRKLDSPLKTKPDEIQKSQVFNVLLPEVRLQLLNLPLPKEEIDLLAKSFAYLSPIQQEKYIQELVDVNKEFEIEDEIIDFIQKLPVSMPYKQDLINHFDQKPIQSELSSRNELSEKLIQVKTESIEMPIAKIKGELSSSINLNAQTSNKPKSIDKDNVSESIPRKKSSKRKMITD